MMHLHQIRPLRAPVRFGQLRWSFSAGKLGIEVDCHPTKLDGILPYLASRLRRDPSRPVILHADPNADYRATFGTNPLDVNCR